MTRRSRFMEHLAEYSNFPILARLQQEQTDEASTDKPMPSWPNMLGQFIQLAMVVGIFLLAGPILNNNHCLVSHASDTCISAWATFFVGILAAFTALEEIIRLSLTSSVSEDDAYHSKRESLSFWMLPICMNIVSLMLMAGGIFLAYPALSRGGCIASPDSSSICQKMIGAWALCFLTTGTVLLGIVYEGYRYKHWRELTTIEGPWTMTSDGQLEPPTRVERCSGFDV